MSTFAYAGRTRAGQTVSGERVADSLEAAVSALRREQILVTKIAPARAAATAAAKKPGKLGKRVKEKSLAGFVRPLSVTVAVGRTSGSLRS